jgi:auxin efflux carrier family protein
LLLDRIITVGAGFIITKADIFPLTAARGCSQVLLYITIPCLMFSKIVPSFNQDNISAFGKWRRSLFSYPEPNVCP